MRRILIIGSKSFIGQCLKKELVEKSDFRVELFDIEGIDPEIIEFREYDTVVWAESFEPCRKGNQNPELYEEINNKLAFHTAYIAKACGVKHFVVLSSIDVYGNSQTDISADTIPTPETEYAKSKLMAEKRIAELEEDTFKVSIIRLPAVYSDEKKSGLASIFGKDSKRRKEQIDSKKVSAFIEELIASEKQGLFVLTK